MNNLLRKISLFFAVPLIFVACSNVPAGFHDHAEVKSLEGIIERQSAADEFPGTHKLLGEEEGDEVHALRSLALNLSSSQYLKNKVEVTGSFNPDDDVFEVTGISVVEVLDEDAEKREFTTYKSTEYGFQIGVYSDWEVVEDGDTVKFVAPSDEETEADVVRVSQQVFQHEASVFDVDGKDTPLAAFATQDDISPESLEELARIGVDKLEAIELETQGGVIVYYVYRPGYIYSVKYSPGDGEGIASNKATFNRMVSEFRFLSIDENAPEVGVDEDVVPEEVDDEETEPKEVNLPDVGLKLTSFESLPYKFRATYPASWYYAGSSGSGDVLHHYGFSDEAVTEGNELISMDIISSEIPASAKSIQVGQHDGKIDRGVDLVTIYTEVDGQKYRIVGPGQYEELMIAMLASIESV